MQSTNGESRSAGVSIATMGDRISGGSRDRVMAIGTGWSPDRVGRARHGDRATHRPGSKAGPPRQAARMNWRPAGGEGAC